MRNRFRAFVSLLALSVLVSACSLAGAQRDISYPVASAPLPLTRVTGTIETTRFGVHATDLGRPYILENGSIGYLFGDTCTSALPDGPEGCVGWRSPVLLRSNQMPTYGRPLVFDSAAGLNGDGIAPEIMANGHRTGGEYTAIPTDAVSFPETGYHVMSYMSVREWSDSDDPAWTTNYAGLAWSPDGNRFYRIGPEWPETPSHDSPFQIMSMQRDGDYVYVISVGAGRRPDTNGPMMLMRVNWEHVLDQPSYECWNGNGWGGSCSPILRGAFGEPTLRLLSDGTWAMSYLDMTQPDRTEIVTRTASSPEGPWSNPKVQVTWDQLPRLYGGFIHPWSTAKRLIMTVSTHQPNAQYGVLLFFGAL